jgi:signal transduction histidine kinase
MKALAQSICTFSFVLLCSFAAYTQTAWIDSVKRVIATQIPDRNKVMSLINLSDALNFSYPDSGLMYSQQALSLAEKLNSDTAIFWSIVSVNASLYVLGNYALELDYAIKAFPIAKKLNTPYAISYSNGILGDCYYNLGEYSNSLQYYREVVKIGEKNSFIDMWSVYLALPTIFENLHQYDSALIYAKKGYELFKHIPALNKENDDNKRSKSSIFTHLGDAYAGKSYYDSALFYYRMSLPFSNYAHMEVYKVDAYNGMAKIFKEKGEHDSAIWYAKKVLSEKITKNYPQGFLKAANLLAAVYELQKNADSSLKYLHIAINVKDSLFNREKTNAFQNVIFKNQEKQRELEAAKSKLQREYFMYFLIALLGIAIIIAGVIVRNRRIKQLQNMRSSIAADLHDDIGSTLTNISILSELSRQSIQPEDKAGKFLTRINEEVNTTSQALDDIIWSVNVHNDSLDEIVFRMRRYSGELFDADGINYTLDFDDKLSGMKISMEQRHDFYLIFKEAVNNIYKHANASYVSVSLCRKDHHLMMRIEDNGKGITEQNLYRNGLKNMKSRAEKWGGDLHIESGKDKGTVLLLLLPAKR